MKRIEVENNFSSRIAQVYYVDDDKNQYCRIHGGLSWPSGANPGGLVVLGESEGKDRVLGVTLFRVLHTATALSLQELLRKAKEAEGKQRCEVFYADLADKPMVDAFRRVGGRITLRQAPHADDFRFLVQRVQEMTSPKAKRLSFEGNYDLVSELKAIDSEDVSNGRDYPLAKALGYVQASLLAYSHRPDEDREAAAAAEAFYGDFEP